MISLRKLFILFRSLGPADTTSYRAKLNFLKFSRFHNSNDMSQFSVLLFCCSASLVNSLLHNLPNSIVKSCGHINPNVFYKIDFVHHATKTKGGKVSG
ncbi:hypothetical protein POVCU2_0047610 [Plasmodium ovale curtisi]|uniref:Uncharacterized protein n=1 Tax=Plasmodium ovale curtisi TaxID=864141 RepID=A0A1A8X342_PLAOA|nr:hypothetical protein POVCU2_0047610 [Plasmodium ovale curtisi]SBS98177.1 hypothetical protein POVCU1_044110 [Plasmodium ovale curtisi]